MANQSSSASPSAALHKVHAKTAKGKRILDERESKVVENGKRALFIRGTTTSAMVKLALHDLYALKKPDAVLFHERNNVHPWDGHRAEASLEFFSRRNDCSLAMMATHSKKRPHTLTLLRFFDHTLMDMFELHVTDALGIEQLARDTSGVGVRPAFLFNGGRWEEAPELKQLQNYFLDFFQGERVSELNLAGLESVISVTAAPDGNVLHWRVYRIRLCKGEGKLPRIELELMGPSLDLTLGRHRLPTDQQWKQAMQQPAELKPKKEKNVETTGLGHTLGRVHVGEQSLAGLQTRKVKALKPSKKTGGEEKPVKKAKKETGGEEKPAKKAKKERN